MSAAPDGAARKRGTGRFRATDRLASSVRESALQPFLDGDPSVCDLPRVSRLPGFPHQKNPSQPGSAATAEGGTLNTPIAVTVNNTAEPTQPSLAFQLNGG